MSLLPLMKLRLASPETLIDIGRLEELKGATALPDGGFELGALDDLRGGARVDRSSTSRGTRSRASATSRSATAARSAARSPMPTRPRTCRRSASRSTTRVVLRSASGRAGRAGRWVLRRRVPDRHRAGRDPRRRSGRGPLPAGAAGAYRKLEQPASGYSIVGVAAVVASSGGSISHARVALTGVGEVAYRAKAVEAALLGTDGSAAGRRGRRCARDGRGRPSTATSTPIASTGPGWPRSTRDGRSRPRSAVSA